MCNTKRGIEKLLEIIILLLIIPATLFGGEANKKSEEKPKSKSDFVLTIKDSLISLSAKDASLVEIVEEIGSRMKIEVVANISKEKKVTIEFDRLSVEDSIKRLREHADIVYIVVPQNPPSLIPDPVGDTPDHKDSEKEKGKITKIMVFPKGKGEELYKSTKEEKSIEPERGKEEETAKETTRPEPFKFEFDPSEFEK